MGYDLERFKDEVNKEFICSICAGVLEDPVIMPKCEHVFCCACISDWLNERQKCPIDNSTLKPGEVRSVPRIYKNLLGELILECDYASNGCRSFVKLDVLDAHAKECAFNPTALVPCENCGMKIFKGAEADHSCAQELRKYLDAIKLENQEIKEELKKLNEEHTKSTKELKLKLKRVYWFIFATCILSVYCTCLLHAIKLENQEIKEELKKLTEEHTKSTKQCIYISTTNILVYILVYSFIFATCILYTLNKIE